MNSTSDIRRIMAYFIDVFFLYSVLICTNYLTGNFISIAELSADARLIGVVYFTISFWLFKGRTLGLSIFKSRVLKANGNNMTFVEGFLRSAVPVMGIAPQGSLFFGLIIIIIVSLFMRMKTEFKSKNQTLWDYLSNTAVYTK